MRILITGSNGLLGQKLLKLLSQQADVELIATSKGANRVKTVTGFQYYPMDITNPQEVQQVFAQTQPTVIIHTAAITKVDSCEHHPNQANAVNIEGTKLLIQVAEQCNSHFIFLSTDFVFDGETGMYQETDTPNPPNYYGETKLLAERLLQDSKLTWSIVRTVLVYGIAEDLSRSNIILWVKQSLEEKRSIRVVNDQWRTPTLVEDLAMGCWLIAQQQATGIYHISGKNLLTPYQIALETADFFQLNSSLINPTYADEFVEVGRRPLKTGFDITKAKESLGFQPRSFIEGLSILKQQLTDS